VVHINCSAQEILKIEHSEEWVWGLTAKPSRAADRVVRFAQTGELLKHLAEFSRPRSPEMRRAIVGGESVVRRWLGRTLHRFAVPREAGEHFFNLRTDGDSASEFLSQYGVFREQDMHPVNLPKKIRAFWSGALKKKQIPFALPLAAFWNEQDEFKTFLKISALLNREGKDTERFQNFWRANELAETLGFVGCGRAVQMLIADKLNGAGISLEFENGTILPSIFTQYVLPSLYVHVWYSFLTRQPWAECLKCRKLFVVNRPGKRHCSTGCKNAAKQKRYRHRVQSRSQSRAGVTR
jgi:hypothetical protein